MKIAVSIPDEVFEGAERLARRTRKSRSQLVSDALREYVARHSPEELTEAMDRVCAEVGAAKDGFAQTAAQRILSLPMVISQGDIWGADFPDPTGSGPGFRRPVVVVQADALNRSLIATVVCVPLTSNLRWSSAPGNLTLTSRLTGLPKESAANVSQILTLDKDLLTEHTGKLPQVNSKCA